MNPDSVSRRDLLKTGAAGSAVLLLGFPISALTQKRKRPTDFIPNAFLRLGSDGAVTAIVSPAEMGQGIHTALAMVLADELDADWSQVRVEAAPADRVYGNPALAGLQTTEASLSVVGFYATTRNAAAAARMMLVQAAAAQWGVSVEACRTAASFVLGPAGQRLSYGSLVAAAAAQKPPSEKSLKLKAPADFKIIGHSKPRLDMLAQVTGTLTYSLDMQLPGMLTAMLVRAPIAGAQVRSFDATAARKMRAVRAVVETPRGVAVIAEDYWAAFQARKALVVEWDFSGLERFSSAQLEAKHRDLVRTPGKVAVKRGDAETLISGGTELITAEYFLPNIAHAPMEPLNCTIDAQAESVDVWVGSQDQGFHKELVAKILERPIDQVRIRSTAMGGGFGRRGSPDGDFVAEAAEIVKAARDINAPIRCVWSRDDDIKGGFYRPLAADQLDAVVDDKGLPVAWRHRIAARSALVGTQFEFFVTDGIDASQVAGARDLPYGIPNLLVELHSPVMGPTVGWLRAVGNSNVCFAVESFIDELAHHTQTDPVAFRRRLLAAQAGNERLLRVMDTAADKAGWNKPLPAGRGRGIAVHDYWGTKGAQVAEVSIRDGRLVVERVTCAIDCGLAVNPDGVKAQVEGAIIFGLSALLYGEITFSEGMPEQSNFDNYPVLRMDACPAIEVHLVDSAAPPSGVGEAAVPHIAPAVCNAIFAACGRRFRSLPLSRQEGIAV